MNYLGMRPIVPESVTVIERFDAKTIPELHAAEEAALGVVSEKRRDDFCLGRDCARKALTELGVAAVPILRHPSRDPLWPSGVCGSITHCTGYVAAAVARETDVQSIGIDAEPIQPLSAGVLEMISTEAERRRVDRTSLGSAWGVLLFSAKESVFKTWFPIYRTWLGFDQVQIEFQSNANEFVARIESPIAAANCGLDRIKGFYKVGERHVFTCAFAEAAR